MIWIRSGWLRGSIYWVLLVLGSVCCYKTIIPEAQEHFLVSSGPRYTPSFGGFGLREEYPERNICTKNADANAFLRNLQEDWNSWRGVLFLDPFSTEVDWATVVKIAGFNALDTWILFPASSLGRVLPKSKVPEDISDKWADCLTRIFGDQSWKKLYSENPQQSFWGDVQFQRDPGVDGIIKLYKAKLRSLFGRRLMEESKSFANSRNSHMFEFMFCVGSNNEKAIGLAKRIAGHILNAST